MHTDLDQFDGEALRTRFCIIGAGIAGLVLAERLVRRGFEVTVLEAGGLEIEARSQSLYQAEMAEAVHTGTTQGRFRTLGGSSTRWGGQLLPYTDDVFEPPAGCVSASWPIDQGELAGYYPEVLRIMKAGTLPFEDTLLTALGHPPQPFSPQLRVRYSKWAPFGRRNLAHTLGRACLAHSRVHIYTHANVAELVAEQGRVTHARVLDYRGRAFTFPADHFIVAAGTIESSRVLLLSRTLPNGHDLFGRFFHDHVSLHAAVLPAPARRQIMRRLGPFFVDGVLYTAKLEAALPLRIKHDLLAVMAHFTVEEPEDSGISAMRNLLTSVQRGELKQALTRNIAPMLRGVGDVLRLLWASKFQKRRAVSERAIVRMNIDLEQPARLENRIRLSENRDALGLRKAMVDWRIGDREYRSATGFARIMRQELETAGFAPLEWTPGLLEGEERPAMADTYHAMGGLQMGTDPRLSVVDRDLKMHGIANLHVASCAVYPSGGSSNPTFTLMALALRLADHLATAAAAG